MECDRQHRQQKEQKWAYQQQQQKQRAQDYREEQLNRFYKEQAATQSSGRRKDTAEKVRVAEEKSKARGARGNRSLETPKRNLFKSTPALVKPSKESVIQSKLEFQIIMAIYAYKKQPVSEDESKDMYYVTPQRIRDTGKKNYSTRTTQGNKKQKKKVQH